MKKRVFAIFLIFCMALTLLPGTAWATEIESVGVFTAEKEEATIPSPDIALQADALTYGDLSYKLYTNGDLIMITDCNESVTSISIPAQIDGVPVVAIEDYAFAGCANLSDITIPESITHIDRYAFSGCISLTSVTIPESVTYIGGTAFSGCNNLAHITIPQSVTTIGTSYGPLFSGRNKLVSAGPIGGGYSIEYGWTDAIPSGAFSGCNSLTHVVIPHSVTTMGDSIFADCPNLTSAGPIGGGYSIEFGWEKEIPNYAFSGCTSLKDILIPSSINSIGESAFYNCNQLQNIFIPNSIKNIGKDAFYNCNQLQNVVIPEGVTNIEDSTFSGCSALTSITIPTSVTHIGHSAFSRTGLTEISIPDSVTEIEGGAFGLCSNLSKVIIPSSVTSIAAESKNGGYFGIFMGCPKLVSAGPIDGGCSIEFNWTNSIPDFSFGSCSNLKQIIIPDSIVKIGNGSFYKCDALSDVYYGGDEGKWGAIDINNGIDVYSNESLLNATIHYNSTGPGGSGENPDPGPDIPSIPDTDMSIKKVDLPFNGHGISVNWGWSMFSKSAVKNQVWDIFDDNNLAIAGLVLSRAAEDSQQQVETLLGSENYLGFKAVRSKNYDSSANQHPAVTFASKPVLQNGKGEYIVAVVVRGTQPNNWDDYWTDISSLWGGFSTAADHLQVQLDEFLVDNCSAGMQDLRGKVKFFITGHSLGAAVANIMAKNLSDEYGADNVFAYTFASPTTIQSAQAAGNIVNILNIEDGVTKLPGLYDHRHGWEIYFHRDLSAADGFYNRFKELTGRDFNKDSAHDTVVYMSYLLSMSASSRNTKVTLLCVLCPVDVDIYSSQGQLVGRVRNNTISDTVTGKTYIRVTGDEKYIYLLDDDEYSISLVGTDEGTMEYIVQNIDLSNPEPLTEKVYENITLSSGKNFASEVNVQDSTISGTDVSKVPLYVLDNAGVPEKEVLPDGKGTEVPIETPPECDHSYTASVTAPTCTERGYTTHTCSKCGSSYVDTYIAALGHSYGEWTVVTPATTTANGLRERICSRCSDRQTSVIPATGGGSSHDGANSSSNDPVYRIEAPAKTTGGTIKVTPTSASENQRVTITVNPKAGYCLKDLAVTNSKGDTLTLDDKGDGKYTFKMPKGKVTVSAVFQPIEQPWSNPFRDIASNMWFYDAVRFANENGLMNGVGDNLFAPNANLSRAQLAQILYNREGRPTAGKVAFTDVLNGAWCGNAIAWIAEKGIASGYGNGLFGPNDNITREQLAVMLWRYAGEPAATSKELHFNDADEVSGYALDALCWAAENNIINGYGNGELAPKGEATRAQVAQMLKNFLEA